ncbi:MAG: hypothetical protein AAF065_01440 [Verrucomicrobiota bacterium]
MSCTKLIVNKFKWFLKDRLEAYPRLYVKLLNLKHESKYVFNRSWVWHKKVLRSDTELIIEGYPRSGNTFAVHAFNYAQGHENTIIATHSHSAAPVIVGAQRGLPILIVIRRPAEAVASFTAFQRYIRGINEDYVFSESNLMRAIERYIVFYSSILDLIDKCTIATFEEVISDYGAVILRVNEKFLTDFKCFEHDDSSVNEVFKRGPGHMVPSEDRRIFKSKTLQALETGKCGTILEEAKHVYSLVVEGRD